MRWGAALAGCPDEPDRRRLSEGQPVHRYLDHVWLDSLGLGHADGQCIDLQIRFDLVGDQPLTPSHR